MAISFTAKEKKMWVFKLIILPSIMAFLYSIMWNVFGNIRFEFSLGLALIAVFAAMIVAALKTPASESLDIAVIGIILAAAVTFVATAIFTFVAMIIAAIVVTIGIMLTAAKQYHIPIESNIASSVLQFLITWGLLYVAQHVQYTFTFT